MIHKTIEQIKAEYPNPESAENKVLKSGYCVGGAIIRAYEHGHGSYPSIDILVRTLWAINPALTRSKAVDYASDIIFANDARQYKKAWDIADEALNYKGTK